MMAGQIIESRELWIWGLILLHTILIIWFIEQVNFIGAAVTLIGGLIALQLLGHINLYQLVTGSPWAIPAVVLGYLALGVGWGVAKWWLYVREIRANYERTKVEWLSPVSLQNAAVDYNSAAQCAVTEDEQRKLLSWAVACSRAAEQGVDVLSDELKPIWNDFVRKHQTPFR